MHLPPAILALPLATKSFEINRFDNVAAYWGQNSYGAANPGDPNNGQKPLEFYCQNTNVNAFPISFVTNAVSTGGLPEINLSNACGGPYFPGTSLLNCQFLASQISACQQQGKLVTISLGGANTHITFGSDDEANHFADTLWDLFLGGSSSTRPFGDAVLDGVDIDVEVPDPNNARWGTFANRLRSHYNGANKKYYISAAPQCPFPDQSIGNGLNGAVFDFIYVQFYNNDCGVDTYNTSKFNFGTWDNWVHTQAKSKDTKIYLGVLGGPTAGGRGYLPANRIEQIVSDLRGKFPSFGGVMIWDISQGYANSRFDNGVKEALVHLGGTGFKYPPCNAPQFTKGKAYTQGQKVTYDDYIWEARWWTDTVPSSIIGDSGSWGAVSACKTNFATSSALALQDAAVSEDHTGGELAFEGQMWTIKSSLSVVWMGNAKNQAKKLLSSIISIFL